MITLQIPLEPVALGRPRMGRNGSVYTPSKSRRYMNAVRSVMIKHKPKEPLKGPLRLELTFFMKAPQKPKHERPIVKPDLSNLIKAIEDAGNGVLWRDDSQIVCLAAAKHYGPVGIELNVVEVM